jgi:hypothetical protein
LQIDSRDSAKVQLPTNQYPEWQWARLETAEGDVAE